MKIDVNVADLVKQGYNSEDILNIVVKPAIEEQVLKIVQEDSKKAQLKAIADRVLKDEFTADDILVLDQFLGKSVIQEKMKTSFKGIQDLEDRPKSILAPITEMRESINKSLEPARDKIGEINKNLCGVAKTAACIPNQNILDKEAEFANSIRGILAGLGFSADQVQVVTDKDFNF